MKRKQVILLIVTLAISHLPILSFAQEEVDPAKAAQNPLANMYSLPLQNNMNFGIGDYSKTANTLNIQPVIPVTLSEGGWLLINRAIIPFP